ncbi:hypothetical protein EGW08_011764 [Elysia chlorotica]|uniref:Uncharacterized protein n=1 Tax=Elysia chlorotica TaxID=188477 RepID=A0A3S1HJ61_ELYCH|nr:hypothetical protein EGW08_011764 [Elysia chlorotica]
MHCRFADLSPGTSPVFTRVGRSFVRKKSAQCKHLLGDIVDRPQGCRLTVTMLPTATDFLDTDTTTSSQRSLCDSLQEWEAFCGGTPDCGRREAGRSRRDTLRVPSTKPSNKNVDFDKTPHSIPVVANHGCHQLFLSSGGFMRRAHWAVHRYVGHGTPRVFQSKPSLAARWGLPVISLEAGTSAPAGTNSLRSMRTTRSPNERES